MRNDSVRTNLYLLGVGALLSLAALACGGNGASNNDQGVSVTFLGLFNQAELENAAGVGQGQTSGQGGCGRLPDVFLGGFIQLGDAAPEPSSDPDTPIASGQDPAGGFVSVVGIQNNLSGQTFRADRVLLDYYVPGAERQPPSTNAPIALLAGPAESADFVLDQGNGNQNSGNNQNNRDPIRRPIATSLPPALQNLCNRALTRVVIIPPAIREWLNFNRDLLPEAPFKLEVTLRVSGLSSSGNRYETNDGTYDFDVLPESLVTPTEGEDPSDTDTTNDAAFVREDESEFEQFQSDTEDNQGE